MTVYSEPHKKPPRPPRDEMDKQTLYGTNDLGFSAETSEFRAGEDIVPGEFCEFLSTDGIDVRSWPEGFACDEEEVGYGSR